MDGGLRVLAGGPARETESELFKLHRLGLEAQDTSETRLVVREGSVSPRDLEDAAPGKIIRTSEVGDISPITTGVRLQIRHEVVKDKGGHRWTHDKFDRVGAARQSFLDWASGNPTNGVPKYDALFMVDTDIVLGPGVLDRLLEVDADVVYGVFWTESDWGGSHAPWPQVWDTNPYGWTPECAEALNAEGINEVEVFGGGACTLFRGRAFESRYFPLLKSLKPWGNMWAGEDRSYCLGLETRGIKQIAVTGLPIVHCYHPEQQTMRALEETRRMVGL